MSQTDHQGNWLYRNLTSSEIKVWHIVVGSLGAAIFGALLNVSIQNYNSDKVIFRSKVESILSSSEDLFPAFREFVTSVNVADPDLSEEVLKLDTDLSKHYAAVSNMKFKNSKQKTARANYIVAITDMLSFLSGVQGPVLDKDMANFFSNFSQLEASQKNFYAAYS